MSLKPLLIAAPLLAGLMCGCAGRPVADAPGLRFPYAHASYTSINDHRALARSVAPAYVKVTILSGGETRVGRDTDIASRVVSGASGIMVGPSGYVITAAHIARSAAFQAEITTMDGERYTARILRVDPDRELALLRVPGERHRFPSAVPGGGVRRGEAVLAIGTPGNEPGAVTVGRVLRPTLARHIQYGDYGFANSIELEIHVEPGHSGGPVFNTEGRLVGMIAGFDLRGTASGEYVNARVAYAIPAHELMEFVRVWAREPRNN